MTRVDGDGRPNKSARKREIAALHGLAERMLALTDGELERLGVDAALRDALAMARPMRPSGARQRQVKHCVKLMDGEDLAAVITYLDDHRSRRHAESQALHRLERWRERLLADGDTALGELLACSPGVDRQRLRQLCRDARREHDSGRPAGAKRKLLRFLRDAVDLDNC